MSLKSRQNSGFAKFSTLIFLVVLGVALIGYFFNSSTQIKLNQLTPSPTSRQIIADGTILVKFKSGSDFSNASLLLTPALRSRIASIVPLYTANNDIDEERKSWFKIELKNNTDINVFIDDLKKLENVEAADSEPPSSRILQ